MAKERAEFRHKTASMVDQLTGVANRRGFTADCAKLAAAQAERPKPTAVLVADLDHFKSINDRFGHNIGDRVIVAFADTAKAALCDGDVIGRLGGEEFALVLRDVGPEQALRVADAIRTSFADVAATIEGRPVYGTASLGLVVSSDPVLDLGGLMQAADQALYRAKERGRNRVEVASAEPRTGADRFAGFGEAIDKAA
jgi:diguanylate cyclase (GGDEF)-like protein